MQISSRSTIAIHVLVSSVNVNPVVIRKILQQLKAAEIVRVIRGSGGAEIVKKLNEITLLDIYYAVEGIEDGILFHFHDKPNVLCPE